MIYLVRYACWGIIVVVELVGLRVVVLVVGVFVKCGKEGSRYQILLYLYGSI